jgi:hypothetical protein
MKYLLMLMFFRLLISVRMSYYKFVVAVKIWEVLKHTLMVYETLAWTSIIYYEALVVFVIFN